MDRNEGTALFSIPPLAAGRSIPFRADGIAADLVVLARWVCWRLQPRRGGWAKMPVNPDTGRPIDALDSANWLPIELAEAAVKAGKADGIGLVLIPNDDLVALDLDNVVDDQGRLSPVAAEIVSQLGTYTEISPSGRGIRCFARAHLTFSNRKCATVEVFNSDKFATVTGWRWPGSAANPVRCQAALDALVRRFCPAKPSSESRSTKRSVVNPGRLSIPDGGNVSRYHSRLSGSPPRPGDRAGVESDALADEELIARARVASPKFARLWDGNWEGYPSQSEADLALIQVLAYRTRGDAERIDRLFRRSGLMRGKWDKGSLTYGRRTIDKARDTAFAPPGLTEDLSPSRQSGGKGPSLCYKPVSTNSVFWRRFRASDVRKRRRIDSAPKKLERAILSLARQFKACRDLEGKEAPCHRRQVKLWFHENQRHLAQWTWDDVWAAYLVAYGSAKSVAGAGPLAVAFGEAMAAAPPAEATQYEPGGKPGPTSRRLHALQKLVRLCHRLQAIAGDAVFFLTVRDAADLLGVGKSAAWGYLKKLVGDGVLTLIREGSRVDGRGSEYRYNGSLEVQ